MGKALLSIFGVVFVDLLGFGLVIPILPYYARSLGASGQQLGWLMAIYSLMQLISAPFWGSLSDRWGRRPVLSLTVALNIIALCVLAFSESFEGLFLGRLLSGLFGGNLSVATAYISDVTDEKNRAKGMGLIGAAFGLGFIFGPALGGILAHGPWGYGTPALFAAGLSAFNAVLCFFTLKEATIDPAQRLAHRDRRWDFKLFLLWSQHRPARTITLIFFAVTLAFTQMEVSFAWFMKDRFGFDAKQAGLWLAYMGVIMVVLQGGLIGRLSKRFSEWTLSLFGIASMGIALMILFRSQSLWQAVVGFTLIALGQGCNTPSLMSLISKASPAERKGGFMGIYQSAGALARILGPLTAGMVMDRFPDVPAPFLVATMVLGLTGLASWSYARWIREIPAAEAS